MIFIPTVNTRSLIDILAIDNGEHNIVGQLRPQKWHYCAVSVKSVRFGRECKQSKSNIFLICHILWHFQDGRH